MGWKSLSTLSGLICAVADDKIVIGWACCKTYVPRPTVDSTQPSA